MNIEKLLEINHINYKKIDEEPDDFILLKVDDRKLTLVIFSDNNNFKLNRDLFDYLDGNKLPYSLVLNDKSANDLYFLEFKTANNWLKGSFDTSDKDEIYLGKVVLNNQLSKTELVNKLKMN